MKLSETDDKVKDDKLTHDERLKSFFESNDEKFRNLINEHRQFQLNQRKALFNRALRQTLSQSLVYPGLQTCRTYEPPALEGINSINRVLSSSEMPQNRMTNVNASRNLPTPKYYVPKRLPQRPNTPRAKPGVVEENNSAILDTVGDEKSPPQSSFFNNSFGIRALGRRIEGERRIQCERRSHPSGIQRSISLDVPSSPQKNSVAVTNLSTSSSFSHGSKSRPTFLSLPPKVNGYSPFDHCQSRISNQALSISEAVIVANNNKNEVAANTNSSVHSGPKDSRPPLKRQNNVGFDRKIDDEDSIDQFTDETYLSGSASDSFCQPEMFQDSGTKVTSCRQPLVSFNDIVDYLSISTDDNGSFEDSKIEELQAMFGQYRNGFADHEQNDDHVKDLIDDVNYENSSIEEKGEMISKEDQVKLKAILKIKIFNP